MADLPGFSNDIFSTTVSSIRKVIQGRTQNEDVFGRPRKTPSYEELRQREESILKGIGRVQTPLDASSDWRKGGPSSPEVNSPNNAFTDRSLFIYDLETGEKIKIQFVPQELDYNPESNFVAIASMARNNPLYHYTGSEDTLQLTLDWHSQQEDRTDVILNCKKLEALTKNDSFNKPPHHVKLVWNSLMYANSTWLVVAAPYKLSLFQAHRNMLPQQAIQTLTLKRITEDNTNVDQIRTLTY